jgi:hypothetical protein
MIKQNLKLKRTLLIIVASMFAIFLLIQLFPYGRTYTNPPVVAEPKWDSPTTREIAVRACFECHSNTSEYPWYSYIAPASWLIRYDIDHARDAFNFSDWYGSKLLVDLMEKRVMENKMPPWRYRIFHPEANLSEAEKQQFINGMYATVGQ